LSSTQLIEDIMTGAVSSASTPTISTITTTGGNSDAAALQSELASKQVELAQAKTDDDKARINAEIAQLKAQIAALQTTGQDAAQASKQDAKADVKAKPSGVTPADKAAPESRVSSSAMDVLMRFGPQGGMMPPGVRNGAGGPPNIAQIYSDMDSDSDGKVTKDEFVAGSKDRLGEDKAGKLFDRIDSRNAGSITEEQFAEGVMHGEGHRHMGPHQGNFGSFGQGEQALADTDAASAVTV
jgi:hypothetical protein